MATLFIEDRKKFDNEVWQCDCDFCEMDYNIWLRNAIESLDKIYEESDGNSELYVLGDVINMLCNMEIKVVENKI